MTQTPFSNVSNPNDVCEEVQAGGGGTVSDSPAPAFPTRLVVKVGTSTLTNAQGRIDRAFIADLTAQMARLRALHCDVVLVTSGAIRAGREALKEGGRLRGGEEETRNREQGIAVAFEQDCLQTTDNKQQTTDGGVPASDTLPYKQAAAAIGQGLLMHTYTEAFAWRDVTVAQILLTRDDLSDPARFANAQNTLRALLALGVIPIINENDTVAVEEIKFGDNDTLAALVATLVGADLLLILSDVEGLYALRQNAAEGRKSASGASGQTVSSKPRTTNHEPQADLFSPDALISVVARVDEAIASLAGGVTSGVGTGGMRTKVEAARIATNAGIRTVIARGRRDRVIEDVANGQPIGTTFLPQSPAHSPFAYGTPQHQNAARNASAAVPHHMPSIERMAVEEIAVKEIAVEEAEGGTARRTRKTKGSLA